MGGAKGRQGLVAPQFGIAQLPDAQPGGTDDKAKGESLFPEVEAAAEGVRVTPSASAAPGFHWSATAYQARGTKTS